MVLKRSSLRKADLGIHVHVQARCGRGRENIIPTFVSRPFCAINVRKEGRDEDLWNN